MSDGVDRVSGYLGEIDGSFHERWFYSAELDRDMPYYIYLPPDYGTAGRRYPVIYMLHGGGGDREEWVAFWAAMTGTIGKTTFWTTCSSTDTRCHISRASTNSSSLSPNSSRFPVAPDRKWYPAHLIPQR
jgi:hypothetical protein